MGQLALHSRGTEVRQLQQLLNEALHENPPLSVDGIFGPKTQGRVIAFQKKVRLASDGIVGPLTNKALVATVLSAKIKGR